MHHCIGLCNSAQRLCYRNVLCGDTRNLPINDRDVSGFRKLGGDGEKYEFLVVFRIHLSYKPPYPFTLDYLIIAQYGKIARTSLGIFPKMSKRTGLS